MKHGAVTANENDNNSKHTGEEKKRTLLIILFRAGHSLYLSATRPLRRHPYSVAHYNAILLRHANPELAISKKIGKLLDIHWCGFGCFGAPCRVCPCGGVVGRMGNDGCYRGQVGNFGATQDDILRKGRHSVQLPEFLSERIFFFMNRKHASFVVLLKYGSVGVSHRPFLYSFPGLFVTKKSQITAANSKSKPFKLGQHSENFSGIKGLEELLPLLARILNVRALY